MKPIYTSGFAFHVTEGNLLQWTTRERVTQALENGEQIYGNIDTRSYDRGVIVLTGVCTEADLNRVKTCEAHRWLEHVFDDYIPIMGIYIHILKKWLQEN